MLYLSLSPGRAASNFYTSIQFLFRLKHHPYYQVLCLLLLLVSVASNTRAQEASFSVLPASEKELHEYDEEFLTIPANEEERALIVYNKITSGIENERNEGKLEGGSYERELAKSKMAYAHWYFSHAANGKALQYYQEALEHLRGSNAEKVKSAVLSGLLTAYHQSGKKDSVAYTFQQVLKHQGKVRDSLARAINTLSIAAYYDIQGRMDTAMQLYEEVLRSLTQQKSYLWRSNVLSNIASKVHKQGNIEKALAYYEEALSLCAGVGDKTGEVKILINLGALYDVQMKPEVALEYLDQAQDLNEALGNPEVQAKIYHRKAGLYTKQNDCVQSLKYHKKSLDLVTKHQMSPWVISMCLSNIAEQYNCLGKYEEALSYLDKVLAKGDNFGHPTFYALNLARAGRSYHALGKLSQAARHLEEALEIYQDIKHSINIERVSKELSEIYEAQKSYEQAFKYLKISNALKDDLFESKIEKLIVEKEKKYALEKEQQKAALREEKIRGLEEEKKRERMLLIASIVILVLLVAIIFLGLKYYQQRKEKLEMETESQLRVYQKEMDLLQLRVNSLLNDKKQVSEQSVELDTLNKYLKVTLTSRELDVLAELVQGKSNTEIGDTLCISINTVGSHLKNIYSKLDVNNRVQAVQLVAMLSTKEEQ